MEIHKNKCALRKLSKFHVSKAFQLRRPSTVYTLPLLMCTRISLVPWSWYCSAVNRDAVRHNMLLLLHIIALSNSGMFFYWLRINNFSGSARLLWIRVSLQSVMLCKHECHFVSGISQSNFCIFHNTTESVIIMTWNNWLVFTIISYYICDWTTYHTDHARLALFDYSTYNMTLLNRHSICRTLA